ncbi:Catalyzes methyl transfer from S-methylmethionine (SMM) to adenosyl-L-homocysteine (AdoMet) [Coemansia guatemalensis]|uniref:Catalyzes methyl transfer from S-methylmethionine (SMM) to adenosyl-L-homocysteine (AdoMet) n=1 Tax=Coemansia guatemalensis TaxID=2761395 RepID=A0A9W8HUP0_9FUNG|nr:Catalyzes methyl transfer from S-methylmethionine (SMM) to adenosyl-L-homocysteine (AdoMet) [Coemansia guatemalensis]
MASLASLLARAGVRGRAAILDGGLGQLIADELPDADISDGLWACGVAIRSPETIKRVHRQYLDAGADIITTATYQASERGYIVAGMATDSAEADDLMAAALNLAVEARSEYLAQQPGTLRRPLIAASLGSIGATLGNSSEYTGDYGRHIAVADIQEFHLQRFHMLARCLEVPKLCGQIDLVAIETVPSLVEAAAIVDALCQLEQHGVALPPAWISFTASSEGQIAHGEAIADAARAVAASPSVCATGINCVPQHYVPGLLTHLRRATSMPIICYPNCQTWTGSVEGWANKDGQATPVEFAYNARLWVQAGAMVVGGCCRTTPAHIRALAETIQSMEISVSV